MDKIIGRRRREFTKGEELANAISHLAVTVLAMAGIVLMNSILISFRLEC